MAESNYRLQALAGLAACRTDSETPVLVGQRKRLALLAALAASDNSGVPRDRLLTWFWPEADATRARNALKQLVHAIRRELGADVIVDANGFLALAPDVMTSDVQSFREALRTGALVRAVEIYRGPFLDGIYVPDVPEFERWTEETRQGLVTDYANALARLAESALESGDAAAAVSWARRLVALDSLRTRSVLLYMRALDAAGDPGAAIQQGELHARVLREELGAPSPVDIERMLYGLRQPHAPLPATAGPESASASSTERRSTGEPADRSVYAAAAALDNPSAVAASEPLPWTRRSWSTRRVWLASVLGCV